MSFYKACLLVATFTLTGCSRYYLSLEKERVNSSYLCSSAIHSPDPRQENPPRGEKLLIEWYIPKAVMNKKPHIEIELVYWDFSSEKLSFPIRRDIGWVTYDVLGDKYKSTKGILTYKAEIKEEDGEVYKTWTHKLWVKMIRSQDEPVLSRDELLEEPTYDEVPFDNSW